MDDPVVVELGAQLLRVLSVSGLFIAVALVYTGGLQGTGDTRSPLYISLISQVVIPLRKKDRWNASDPSGDAAFASHYTSPEVTRLANLLYPALDTFRISFYDRTATEFVGLVYAQDDEEEGSYLSTQLVDEVRHMQFYVRFQNEVVADSAAIADHVARAPAVPAPAGGDGVGSRLSDSNGSTGPNKLPRRAGGRSRPSGPAARCRSR
jgi:hypothetical protein